MNTDRGMIRRRRMRPAATLIGSYDDANLGDDALAHLFACALRARGYRRVHLPNASPGLRRRLDAEAFLGTRRAIDASSLVIMGGGGLLGFGVPGPDEHRAFDYYWRVAWYCRITRKPLYVLGVGAGPFSTEASRRRVRQIAYLAHRVILRDEASHRELVALDPRFADWAQALADPVMTLEPDALPWPPAFGLARPGLGVNLCGVSCFRGGLSDEQANGEVVQAVNWMLEERRIASVLWFSTAGAGERSWACRALESTTGPSRLVAYAGDPWSWLARLRECDAFLSMKLHSAIFAAGLGVPLMGIGAHPKIRRFYEQVDALPFYRSLDTLAPGAIGRFLDEAFPGAQGLRDSSRWRLLQERARQVFEAIPVVGRPAPPAKTSAMSSL